MVGSLVRFLFASWVIAVTLAVLALSGISWSLHRSQTAEHAHSNAASTTAIAAAEQAQTVASWQATLSASVASALGDYEAEVRRRLTGICAGLYAIARTVPLRADVPQEARAACPSLPARTAGAHERLDPLAHRRR